MVRDRGSKGMDGCPLTPTWQPPGDQKKLITKGVVSVYLDDILIFTKMSEKTKIEYLSIIISHNKVEMDPVKISGIADWPTPLNKKEV
jgi:hypothetical protein